MTTCAAQLCAAVASADRARAALEKIDGVRTAAAHARASTRGPRPRRAGSHRRRWRVLSSTRRSSSPSKCSAARRPPSTSPEHARSRSSRRSRCMPSSARAPPTTARRAMAARPRRRWRRAPPATRDRPARVRRHLRPSLVLAGAPPHRHPQRRAGMPLRRLPLYLLFASSTSTTPTEASAASSRRAWTRAHSGFGASTTHSRAIHRRGGGLQGWLPPQRPLKLHPRAPGAAARRRIHRRRRRRRVGQRHRRAARREARAFLRCVLPMSEIDFRRELQALVDDFVRPLEVDASRIEVSMRLRKPILDREDWPRLAG